jgi:hypothetical protein
MADGEHGPGLGAAAGFVTAILWLLAMRSVVKRAEGWRALLAGTGLGMAAGALATVMLQYGLWALYRTGEAGDLLFCILAFGLPAGFVTGVACSPFAQALLETSSEDP